MKSVTPISDAAEYGSAGNNDVRIVSAAVSRQIEIRLTNLRNTANEVAAWLERSSRIAPAILVSRNLDLAKELRQEAMFEAGIPTNPETQEPKKNAVAELEKCFRALCEIEEHEKLRKNLEQLAEVQACKRAIGRLLRRLVRQQR